MFSVLDCAMVPPHGNDKDSTEEALRQRSALGQAVMLGTNVAAGMILFTLFGYYVDYKRGTGHFWTLAAMGMGIAYAAYEFWSTLRVLQRMPPDSRPSDVDQTDPKGSGKAVDP